MTDTLDTARVVTSLDTSRLTRFEGTATAPLNRRIRGRVDTPQALKTRGVQKRWPIAVGFLVALAWCLWSAGIGRRQQFNPRGWPLVNKFISAAFAPELSGNFVTSVARATATTIGYAALGTLSSVVIGAVAGLLLSNALWRRSTQKSVPMKRPWAAQLGCSALTIPRGMHEAVWGLLLVNVLGRDPLVAILAIALPYGAITAKVYSELIDETSWEGARALRASGASRTSALFYGVLPGTARDLASYGFYRFECSIRAAVILGMIGAGGLGFQLMQSFDGLAYHEMWTVLYVLLAMSLLAEALSSRLRKSPTARNLRWSGIGAGVVIIVSVLQIGVKPWTLWSPRTRTQFVDIVQRSWPPRPPFEGWGSLVTAMRQTLELSFLAIVLATALSIPVAILGARRTGPQSGLPVGKGSADGSRSGAELGPVRSERGSHSIPSRAVSTGARVVAVIARSIPPTVWALLVLFVVFPGPFPGAIALGMYTFGVLTRLFLEVLENSDPRPARSLQQIGARGLTPFAYGTLPEAASRWTAFALYRWEVAARESVVVGVVGAGGLGRILQSQRTSFDFQGMVVTVCALIIVTWFVDRLSSRLRAALR
jgi:phosphonate transport system permease protein